MGKHEHKEPVTEIPEELMQELEEAAGPAPEPEKKEEKKDDVQERYIRLAADFDNFRKRVHKEKAEYVRYANENLVKDLLPILDNLERALEHARTEEKNPMVEGVTLILSQLQSTLQRYGIRSESAAGKTFDPLVHDAVSQIHSDTVPVNGVIQEHHKAYYLHDRLIRPAMVTVSKGPEGDSVPEVPDNNSDPQVD